MDSRLGKKYRGHLYIKNTYNRHNLKFKVAAKAAILKIYFELPLIETINLLETW